MKNIIRKIFHYAQFINNIIPKNSKLIVLYSNLGFRDNVKVFFDYLVEEKYNEKYTIVCVSNNFYDSDSRKYKNVKYVGVVAGLIYFFRARFFFYCFGKYPIKPSRNQVIVNFWHGMPIKKIGNLESGKEKVDYNFFTYIIAYSNFFKKIMKDSFKASEEQILIDEAPRNTLLINPKTQYKFNQNMKKHVVWLPTYRDSADSKSTEGNTNDLLPLMKDKNDLLDLDIRLNKLECELLIKLHPLQKENIPSNLKLSNITFINDADLVHQKVELYDLLGRSDGLITDYSSVSIDYLLTDKPIGYCIYDIDEYASSRGFNFKNIKDVMSGPFILQKEDLYNFFEDITEENDSFEKERKILKKKFHKYEDANSNLRMLNLLGITKE
ncbi:hypothetical protein LCW_02415 [Latilactobacillus curvatus]|uniref:CDP-glycerol glycerophosphotransferase family protein n=1 Tax=Latilactobacillus curvatus TaxID=28038 RepID=UPI00084A2151|nr:CDP-glycerol glycerophosphotransferase family protein [Latilactobacillus curvatus]AOO74997.1 hypothetical protein LCW_02415 [Latilactobacillus curvatus]